MQDEITLIKSGRDFWALVGCCSHTDPSEQTVAIFSTKEKAEDYLEWAKLEKPTRYNDKFKFESLLAFCNDARVEGYIPYIMPPIDPEILS